MTSQLAPLLVDDRAVGRLEPVAGEEVAVVAAGQEAGLLALASLGRC